MDVSDKRHLQIVDPVRRQAERGFQSDELSPMDPPDVYAPPAVDAIPKEQLHPFLRHLTEEHASLIAHLDAVERAVQAVGESGYRRETQEALEAFLEAFEAEFIPHSREEEQTFFRRLAQRLIETGEHSSGDHPTTAIDIMFDEHLRANQIAAGIAAMLVLAPRIRDAESRKIVLASALGEVMRLVELLRLHMFREDNIVFASAQRLLPAEELDGY